MEYCFVHEARPDGFSGCVNPQAAADAFGFVSQASFAPLALGFVLQAVADAAADANACEIKLSTTSAARTDKPWPCAAIVELGALDQHHGGRLCWVRPA